MSKLLFAVLCGLLVGCEVDTHCKLSEIPASERKPAKVGILLVDRNSFELMFYANEMNNAVAEGRSPMTRDDWTRLSKVVDVQSIQGQEILYLYRRAQIAKKVNQLPFKIVNPN